MKGILRLGTGITAKTPFIPVIFGKTEKRKKIEPKEMKDLYSSSKAFYFLMN